MLGWKAGVFVLQVKRHELYDDKGKMDDTVTAEGSEKSVAIFAREGKLPVAEKIYRALTNSVVYMVIIGWGDEEREGDNAVGAVAADVSVGTGAGTGEEMPVPSDGELVATDGSVEILMAVPVNCKIVGDKAVATNAVGDVDDSLRRVGIKGDAVVGVGQLALRDGVVNNTGSRVEKGKMEGDGRVATIGIEGVGRYKEGGVDRKGLVIPEERVADDGMGVAGSDSVDKKMEGAEAVAAKVGVEIVCVIT